MNITDDQMVRNRIRKIPVEIAKTTEIQKKPSQLEREWLTDTNYPEKQLYMKQESLKTLQITK